MVSSEAFFQKPLITTLLFITYAKNFFFLSGVNRLLYKDGTRSTLQFPNKTKSFIRVISAAIGAKGKL